MNLSRSIPLVLTLFPHNICVFSMTCVLPRETADFLRLTSLLNTCRIFGATSLLACLARGLRRSLTLLIKDLTFYFIPVSEHRDIKSFPSLPEPCHLIRILTDFNLTDILPYAYFYLYRVNELTHVLDLRTYRLPEETKPNMEWLHPHEIGMFTHAQRELNNATDAAYKHIDSLYAEWECPSRSGRCNRRFAEYREECRARGVHFPYAGKVYPKMGYQEMCPGCKEAYERWMENVVLKYFMKLVKAVFGRVGMGMYRDNRTNGRSEQQRYELDGNQSNMKGNGEFKSTYEVFQGRREWGRKDPPRYPATRVELLYTHRYDRRPTPAPDHRSTDGWQRPYAVNNHMVLTDQRMAPKGIQPGRAYDRVGSIPIRMFSTASS